MTQSTVAGQQLKSIIDRIEKLEEEKRDLAEAVKEIYTEAHGNGFDKKAIRKIVSARRKSMAERKELEAVIDTYAAAIGEGAIV